MRQEIWYRRYDELSAEVERLRDEFRARCEHLGVNQETALRELQAEVIARAVHESNWQEGLYLDPHRTRELTDLAFSKLPDIAGPHLDIDRLIDGHRSEVSYMKKQNSSVEEIAAYNLSKAHMALSLIRWDMSNRMSAILVAALKEFEESMPDVEAHIRNKSSLGEKDLDLLKILDNARTLINPLIESKTAIGFPITGDVSTEGEMLKQLMKLDSQTLYNLMHPSYLHALHRITLMGVHPNNKLGVFRKTSVHVGDDETYFPLPSAVPQMVQDFCEKFPNISVNAKYDRILMAAQMSHRFVRIHPYSDGNGRVSRLLMNLILMREYPPVYLKADKKGRSRYIQSLRRANRGDVKPLGCLIAMSLIAIYTRALDAISTN